MVLRTTIYGAWRVALVVVLMLLLTTLHGVQWSAWALVGQERGGGAQTLPAASTALLCAVRYDPPPALNSTRLARQLLLLVVQRHEVEEESLEGTRHPTSHPTKRPEVGLE